MTRVPLSGRIKSLMSPFLSLDAQSDCVATTASTSASARLKLLSVSRFWPGGASTAAKIMAGFSRGPRHNSVGSGGGAGEAGAGGGRAKVGADIIAPATKGCGGTAAGRRLAGGIAATVAVGTAVFACWRCGKAQAATDSSAVESTRTRTFAFVPYTTTPEPEITSFRLRTRDLLRPQCLVVHLARASAPRADQNLKSKAAAGPHWLRPCPKPHHLSFTCL